MSVTALVALLVALVLWGLCTLSASISFPRLGALGAAFVGSLAALAISLGVRSLL